MKVVIAIDPGAPKKRDNAGTTGVFVGNLSKIARLEGHSLVIESNEIDEGIKRVAGQIKEIYDKYIANGDEVIVVIEEYKNYDWNGAANSMSKNEVSQLIGAIKMTIPGTVVEQSTANIKTAYGDNTLMRLGLLEKNGNRRVYPVEVCEERKPSTRHEIDAYRHYLVYRKSKNYMNRIGRLIYE